MRVFYLCNYLIIKNILIWIRNWHSNKINGLRGKSDGLPAYLFLGSIFFNQACFVPGLIAIAASAAVVGMAFISARYPPAKENPRS